ncbi:hypothetical protein DFA_11777 [Cavenderia fasciculata]|uniref:FAD-binding domain-containing protein n=1 Tax=Cavenderia fasciculata TaxID=261658 RepID=F4QE68_CACFS|nr:uncharacterized protein DFA_11777 [Cavenderia fasciculata]EGG14015.1 hypothetical protein DFA_11777 [Cavenderia fasciculata]|eukprot:XP_004350723.1 hypothetical protein DFA_11777 [Cavenderia fasciculata]
MVSPHYDVVVIGAGIAGLSQCRHLLLKIPGLRDKRVAIIDPRSTIRNNQAEDFKVGESTELELQDYLVENQPPKFTLQFHWPRNIEKTDSMDDYYSTWAIKNPEIQSFQLNRSKIEKDLLQMILGQGAIYYHGRVKDVDITEGDNIKTVDIQMLSDEDRFEDQKQLERISITTDYIVDASGRNFIIGSRTDNILKGPENLFGLANGSTWVRVKAIDKKYFDFNSQDVTASWYYDTNHFFGPGYWLWMIPIERGSHDFSIGVSYHKDRFSPTQFNSYEKFMSFLEKNQKILYNLIKSGEIIDFHRWPTLPHTSKRFVSPDNWSVIGDAAAIFDPFYSTGMTMIAQEVECVTEIIRHKLAGDEKGVADRVDAYDKLVRTITQINNHLIKSHSKHLGNASVMSWRIYMESTNYFGTALPVYIGKYHLCPVFCRDFAANVHFLLEGRDRLLKLMDYMVDNNINAGFMDNHRGDNQLSGSWAPAISWDYDGAIKDCKYGFKRLNIHKYIVNTMWYDLRIVTLLYYRVYGLAGLVHPDYLWLLSVRSIAMTKHSFQSLVHQYNKWGVPANEYYHKMGLDFKSYSYNDDIIPWNYD